jgi:hypothetical protein
VKTIHFQKFPRIFAAVEVFRGIFFSVRYWASLGFFELSKLISFCCLRGGATATTRALRNPFRRDKQMARCFHKKVSA